MKQYQRMFELDDVRLDFEPAALDVLSVAPITEDQTWLHTATRLLLAVSVAAVMGRQPLAIMVAIAAALHWFMVAVYVIPQ